MKKAEFYLEYLKNKFEIVEFPISGISNSFISALKNNALFRPDVSANIEALKFHAYKIFKTEEYAYYFSEKLTDFGHLEFPVESPDERELLLYIYEEETNYIWLNNTYLFLELIIAHGFPTFGSEIEKLEYESSLIFFNEYQEKLRKAGIEI